MILNQKHYRKIPAECVAHLQQSRPVFPQTVSTEEVIMIGSRIMAVGDVHGQYEKLKKLMRRIKFDPAQDILIFLGDLIDRGPESLQCFDYVMHLQKQYPESVICLMGNHEREMLDYFDALAKAKDELDIRLLNRTSQWLEPALILPRRRLLFLSCRRRSGRASGTAGGKGSDLDPGKILYRLLRQRDYCGGTFSDPESAIYV